MTESFDPYYIWLGIPPDQQPPNHYRLLGLQSAEDDLGVVQNAVDRLRRHVQSFAGGEHQAAADEILGRIDSARLCLLDNSAKSQYDEQLNSKAGPISPPVPVAQPAAGSTKLAGKVEPQVVQVGRSKSNPAWEAGKVILGGFAGIGLAVLLLQFVLGVNIFGGSSDTVADAGSGDSVNESRSDGDNDRLVSKMLEKIKKNERRPRKRVKKKPAQTTVTNQNTESPKVVVIKPVKKAKKAKKRRGRRRPSRRRQRPRKKPKKPPVSPFIASNSKPKSKQAKPKLEDPSNNLHEWVGMDGSFRHQAYFQSLKSGTLKLELENGNTTTMPVSQLRAEGQQLAARLHSEQVKYQVEQGLNASFVLFRKGKASVKEGAKRLKQTATLDPNDLRANFWLGLFSEVLERRHLVACSYLHKCLKVDSTHVPTLNNLAVAEIRARRFDRAIRHFQEAVDATSSAPELIHNVTKFQMEVNNKRIRLGKTVAKKLAAVHSLVQSSGATFNRRKGWLFIGLPGRNLKLLKVSLEDRRCLTCDGSAFLKCPVRECKRGLVRVRERKKVGTNRKTGAAIYNFVITRKKCKTCTGKSAVACPHCKRGVDKRLR